MWELLINEMILLFISMKLTFGSNIQMTMNRFDIVVGEQLETLWCSFINVMSTSYRKLHNTQTTILLLVTECQRRYICPHTYSLSESNSIFWVEPRIAIWSDRMRLKVANKVLASVFADLVERKVIKIPANLRQIAINFRFEAWQLLLIKLHSHRFLFRFHAFTQTRTANHADLWEGAR